MQRLDAVLRHLDSTPPPRRPLQLPLYPHPTSSSIAPPPPPAPVPSPLDAERTSAAAAFFPVQALTHFLDGSPAITELKATVAALIEADPVLNPPSSSSPSIPSLRRSSMAKIHQCATLIRTQATGLTSEEPTKAAEPGGGSEAGSRAGVGRAFEDAFYSLMSLLDPAWSIRMGVHYGLFRSSVHSQGTETQRAEWEVLIGEMRVIGSFAMTELGHGSNVAAIETEATWVSATPTPHFDLHSPTVTAAKWWIGGAAEMSTHAAVYARLLVDGVDLGVHCFVVRIRDEEGRVTPGVTLGDMGEKMGRNGLDNGYIRFHHLSLPPTALLQRWTALTEDGRFVTQTAAGGRTTYAALIQTRVELLTLCSDTLKQALTIAVRYACVRRQGWRGGQHRKERGTMSTEVALIDYQTHQARLIPLIALAIGLHFTAKAVAQSVASLVLSLASPSPSPSLPHSLESVHATTCALKAFSTWAVNDALEVCRQSLGGQGYSAHSLLPRIRNDWAVMCTWEGDNTVLALQCAKHCIRRALDPPQLADQAAGQDPFDYLLQPEEAGPEEVTAEGLAAPAEMARLFRVRAQRSLRVLLGMAQSPSALLESHASSCVEMARAHCDCYMVQCFAATVEAAPAELREPLTCLHTLRCCCTLLQSSSFLPASPLTPSAYKEVAALQSSLLIRLRPWVVPLTDAFALPDFVLGPLGRRDGGVYDALYEAVRGDGTKENGKAEYWEEYIRPMLVKDEEEVEGTVQDK